MKINNTNVANMIIVSRSFVILELLMIAFSVIDKGKALFAQPKIIFFVMYVVMALAALVNSLIFSNFQKNISEHEIGIRNAGIIFTTFILLWCAGISLLDQFSYGQIIVYISAVIAIAVVPIFQPYVLFSIYLLVQSIFILLMFMFVSSDGGIFGNMVNSTLLMLLFLVISRMRYKNCVKTFENEKNIEEKSRELKKVNDELKAVNEKLKYLSQRDGLTNIFNRSMFDKTMNLEWNKCLRNQLPLSLVMIDIDLFKTLNDTFGHQIGDCCLRQVADVLVFCANRAADVVSRYGGDEFAVILPQTDKDGALTIAKKLQEKVAELTIPEIDCQACQSLTISIGVSCIVPSENSSIEELLKNADQALYEAKKVRDDIQFQSADKIQVSA
ncbi:diguanylate cyclase [Acetobacterium paludosum]|uniref:Diguanylate cyclase n=1 Tax=Acetobacterium paludosum TaxID=52693 RepID=A0A923HW21_9FIRM|nr:GGDEF domain-containing protein [Acetobacterium paludosum]MBC3889574.1 diguanylate cyclase [Acetobacterium paludosum]